MSTHVGPDNITDSLVYSVDGGNTKSYPGSGTSVFNMVAIGSNTGTLTNGVTFGSTKIGEFVFDGVDDYINVATSPLTFASNTSSTVCFWLNVSSLTANYGIVLAGAGPFNSTGVGLEIRYQTTTMECAIADGVGVGIRTTLSNALSANQWNYFCFAFDRDALQGIIYKNGASSSTTSYAGETTNNTSYAMTIGKGSDGYLTGRIAMFSVYNRALSAEEVARTFNSTKSRFL